MPILSASRRAEIARLFDTCSLLPSHLADIDAMVRKILSRRAAYEEIAAVVGVPWYFVAVIHARESGCDFTRHLHNGDSLQRRTWHVPANRPPWGSGPYSFVESAEDALQYQGFTNLTDLRIASLLWKLECFNGLGYRGHGIASPYVWSGTPVYSKGKYTGDSQFDPDAVDEQIGVAALLLRLHQKGEIALQGEPLTVRIGGKVRAVGAFVIRGNSMIAVRALVTALGGSIPATGDGSVTVAYKGQQAQFPMAPFNGVGFVDASDIAGFLGRTIALDARAGALVISQ